MNDEQILYNVMTVVEKTHKRLRGLQGDAFHDDDTKLVMAGIIAELELLVAMFGNAPEAEPPRQPGFVDTILHRR